MTSWSLAALLLSLSTASCERFKEFVTPTPINNVVQDLQTGRVYLGAVNAIYQLDSLLEKERVAVTGPKRDGQQCTPPILSSCENVKDTNNTNKLLLVNSATGSLITCGSLFRGLCSLLNLSNVEQQIYYNDNKGEKTYVASIEETVSVVGVMASYIKDHENLTVFVVGKGYGSQDSTKLISTRILQDYGEWVVFENIVEASGVQATSFFIKYLHNFRYAFKEGGFLYFLFTRTRGGPDNKNYTFISRLCENDPHYYSYTELQLDCGLNNEYNKAQAAYVASSGEDLARNLSGRYGAVQPKDKVLFVVSSTDEDKPNSALCMYPLNAINDRFKEILGACYSNRGFSNGKSAVESPYSPPPAQFCSGIVSKEFLSKYECGGDFLPSPLASTPAFALSADAVYRTRDLLTAVAVAVENQHTVAFLGTGNGEVNQVHLSASPVVYRNITLASSGDMVNKQLFFDSNHTYLYVTTRKKISRVPVQMCHLKKDCQSCMALRDPYCGWCVLEGRCSRMSDCRRFGTDAEWLWASKQRCLL